MHKKGPKIHPTKEENVAEVRKEDNSAQEISVQIEGTTNTGILIFIQIQ